MEGVAPYRPWPRAHAGLYLSGLLCALVGFLGPWIPHKAAALAVTGFELSEFAKFFPQVQSGAVPVRRELFLVPLVAMAVELGLFVHASARRAAIRVIGTVVGVALTLAVLPPYQFLRDASYRGRLVLALAGVAAVLVCVLASWLPRRAVGVLVGALALVGGALALWQYALLHPLFVALYDAPVGVGWGAVVCAVGFVLMVVVGGLRVARP